MECQDTAGRPYHTEYGHAPTGPVADLLLSGGLIAVLLAIATAASTLAVPFPAAILPGIIATVVTLPPVTHFLLSDPHEYVQPE